MGHATGKKFLAKFLTRTLEAPQKRPLRRHRRLSLELLEDRTAPAVVTLPPIRTGDVLFLTSPILAGGDLSGMRFEFEHKEGALQGKAWKGIYVLDGDTLKICDNAANLAKGRPAAFEANGGSGYVLITFRRVKP